MPTCSTLRPGTTSPTLSPTTPCSSAFAGLPVVRDAIYWEHEGNRAVRVGQWKAVAKGPGAPWELYDIIQDRVESHDLATRDPDRLAALVAKWEQYAERAQVLPWIWKPAYDRSH